ncbi:glucose-6-phosphate dehydrogenase [Actinomadura rupiterrae]|uniref:glucose-6-phosphate dehydrogenase n=1 Tax=Actinomadura rupiterrae TaxID=559627 RepID=UPI0020A43C87|nr:glucose-6-phosphate dehydrogenase [Actinomadura rupiterrae]MCP2335749.1 glucose-6-phosphate 1-dehydrogenase [Actinomadura rupiterrae]
MDTPQRADALALFGITGDLAAKMLFPALYRLTERGILDVPVIGVAYSDMDDEALRKHAHKCISAAVTDFDENVFKKFASRLSLVTGDFKDGATFSRLRDQIRKSAGDDAFVSHYLAIPPSLFTTVAESLAGEGLNRDARLVVEKPFGHDLASARSLNRQLTRYFDDDHLLRVDHFLGDVAVEGLKAARFANEMLAPIWTREHIDNVQINLIEDFDVADRGSFYDSVGCLKDVIQNHLLQVFTFLAMEPPSDPSVDAEKAEKHKVLQATRSMVPADTVRGQYQGYLDVEGVKPDSTTETYFATRMFVDNWRWEGVPFLLRSGKSLKTTSTEVVVELKRPPVTLYPAESGKPAPNLIRFHMVPEAAMTVELVVKQPERGKGSDPVPLRVDFADVYGRVEMPYENILEGAITGDRTYFAVLPVVEECWRIVEPVLNLDEKPLPYKPGSWGPEAADKMPGPDGWHDVRPQADARPTGPSVRPAGA